MARGGEQHTPKYVCCAALKRLIFFFFFSDLYMSVFDPRGRLVSLNIQRYVRRGMLLGLEGARTLK